MKFNCEFAHPDDIAATTMIIPITLTADDMADLARLREREKQRDARGLPRDTDLETVQLAMALRHAYKLAPDEFQHIRGGVHAVPQVH
jgi:hypothetical protein